MTLALALDADTRRTSRTFLIVRETAPTYAAPAGLSEPSILDASARHSIPASHRSARLSSDRFDDEAVTKLGEEIMTLSEHVQAVTHRLLLLIADFDQREGWRLYGFSSCAEWLAYSARLNKVTAREQVRVARALARLPETSAAMARGEVSFSQVRALTRIADDENELELLTEARTTSADGLERAVRSWKRLGRKDEAEQERRRHEARFLSIVPDDDGGYRVRAWLDPEVGAFVMRAVEAASDALYRGSVPETTPEQRRADALALLLERAMAVGFGHGDAAGAGRVSAEAPAIGESPESLDTQMHSRVSAEAFSGLDRRPASHDVVAGESRFEVSAESSGGRDRWPMSHDGGAGQSRLEVSAEAPRGLDRPASNDERAGQSRLEVSAEASRGLDRRPPSNDEGAAQSRLELSAESFPGPDTHAVSRYELAAESRFDVSAEALDSDATCRLTQPWKSGRYLVILHVDAATLSDGSEPGRSELEDGTRVCAETARRLACDSTLVRVIDGVGRRNTEVHGKTRAVPSRLRRALQVRDRGCRFPGCGSRFTDAHHIKHWADGGATRLDNLILLCRTHHRLLHEGGFRLEPDSSRPGRPTFISPRGIPIPEVPPRMTMRGTEEGAVMSELGTAVRGSPTGARPPQWERDVPLALYLRAMESLA